MEKVNGIIYTIPRTNTSTERNLTSWTNGVLGCWTVKLDSRGHFLYFSNNILSPDYVYKINLSNK